MKAYHWNYDPTPCDVCDKVTKNYTLHRYQAHERSKEDRDQANAKGAATRKEQYEKRKAKGIRRKYNWTDANRARFARAIVENELWRLSRQRYLYKSLKQGEILFRSFWELEWAQYLDSCDILWEYERYYIDCPSGRYTPDFYLPERNIWIEVKGLYTESSRKKVREAITMGFIIYVVRRLSRSYVDFLY
jgi:hypothetical protein